MKRCDDPLLNLASYGGLWLCFRAFRDTPETITRSKRVRSWRRFVCVFISVILLSKFFFSLLNILAKILKWCICQFDKIFIVNTEQVVIHECIRGSLLTLTCIPLLDLCQNVLKEENQARKLKFGVHLRITKNKTHTNRRQDRICFDRVIVSGVSLNALKQSQRPPYEARFSKGSSHLFIYML